MALFQVIRYNGPADVLVWKYPEENMNTGSQLIVNQSQEAVFIREGVICGVLGPGSHTLDTNNLPFLSTLLNLPFGCKSPFTAEVYFVNRLTILDIKWGTAVPVQISDPVYHVAIPLRAFGQYGIAVDDSRLFLKRVVGTTAKYTTADLISYFRGLVGSRIVEALTGFMLSEGIGFLEVNAHIARIADAVCERLSPLLAEYGVRLENLCINSINAPDNDPSVKRLRAALDKKNEMDVIQYDYRQEHTFQVMDHLGTGNSGIAGFGAQAAVGAALAETVKETVRETLQPGSVRRCRNCRAKLGAEAVFCPKCGTPVMLSCPVCGAKLEAGARFCEKCGKPVTTDSQGRP